jgi:hypothetical protein
MGIVSRMSDAAAAAAAPVRLAAHDRDLAIGLLELHAAGVDEYSVSHLDEPTLRLAWGRLLDAGYVQVYRSGSRRKPVGMWLTATGERFARTKVRRR